jgi:hypothetical protein
MFFKEKIIETVGSSAAYDVIFDAATHSPVPQFVRQLLSAQTVNFVEISKQIAKHLHDAQGGASPGGLITVIDCALGVRRAVGILKLEKEEGVRLLETTHEGLRTFDVSYIRDLILTRKTKLFKIGFFYPPDGGGGDPGGTVCDEQRGYMPRTEVAGFFLTEFLGCCLAEDPRISTKRFFFAAQDFFNEQIKDPVERTQALVHLLSELTNQKARVNLKEFARDHLPVRNRQPFLDHMQEEGFRALTIVKNLELIESQTKKMAFEFQNGITVVGDREAFRDSVKVDRTREGAARIEITGELKKVQGK